MENGADDEEKEDLLSDEQYGYPKTYRNRIYVGDIQERKVKDVELKGHTDSVDQLCWDPKHNDLVVTAAGDKTFRL
ncbi:uncharacterized protein A4U43_C03F16480 [Asparagus officinalis]|uniref:Uncharacterized protein n=1 Tax=Asparagus officinalis TaxID=4686 RepID=A0A5P1FB49_ASPOF|nr:uncharacterized protein A4U43_C03F16480 [Asparagus officinalis]